MLNDPQTRREFIGDTSKIALSAMIVPRHVLGRGYQAPSDTLDYAVVGLGSQGTENFEALVSENLVSVCDVHLGFSQTQVGNKLRDREGKDRPNGVKMQEQFTKAVKYADFREMLEKQKDIEAVVVATPDHMHAPIAKMAMQMGKHVYVQKPLAYSVHECRVLREVAQKTGVVTQMGNQGHSSKEARLINEWIEAGIIGPVTEVHVFTNRPIWPQGLPRPMQPADLLRKSNTSSWNRRTVNEATASAMGGAYAPPDGMRWDLYLGPVAEDIAYHPVYHPFNWRGWTDFGVGALGDMGAHLIDHPYWALGLTYPTTVEATSTPWGTTQIPGAGPQGRALTRQVSYPLAMTAHYEFPARGAQPPVKLFWYDGGLYPPRPAALPDDVILNAEGGVFYIGEKGILLHETYGGNPRIYPASLMEAAKAVPQKYPRIEGSHPMNWANAAKGQGKPVSPFEYAAALTEVMLLGIVALRAGQGRKILYDAANMKITNLPEANQYLTRQYRPGWEV
jgi:predicted dehydrogenase